MIKRRSTFALLAAAGAASVLGESRGDARAAAPKGAGVRETIAIIGTGEVGGALGKHWAALGHKIVYGSRTPQDDRVQALVKETGHGATAVSDSGAAAAAELILLAVPFAAINDVAGAIGDVSGKILMDPTNAVKVVQGQFEIPPTIITSAGEQIQDLAQGAKVVKAFNTLSVEMMTDSARAPGPVTVPLAGADPAAKARVAEVVRGMGLEPTDCGGMYMARYLEGMARLRMTFHAKNKPNAFEFYLRPRRD